MDRDAALAIAAEHGDELASRLAFVYELDKLKTVLRQSMLTDNSRQENSAEHSWHLAMTAMALAPLADEPIDVGRAIKILLVHDVVEIDAGDAWELDRQIEIAMDALRCPPGEADVSKLSGGERRRVAPDLDCAHGWRGKGAMRVHGGYAYPRAYLHAAQLKFPPLHRRAPSTSQNATSETRL